MTITTKFLEQLGCEFYFGVVGLDIAFKDGGEFASRQYKWGIFPQKWEYCKYAVKPRFRVKAPSVKESAP